MSDALTDEKLIAELERLRSAATPGDLDTAEIARTDEWLECPFCAGEGSVDGATYVNYDDAAVSVQFFGVGGQFLASEALYRALMRALPRLLALAKAGMRAESYERICETIVEIAEDSKMDPTAALVAIKHIADAAPDDAGADWFKALEPSNE